MMQLTDKQAAELVLRLMARSQFSGSELDAVIALRVWCEAKITNDGEPVDETC